MSLEYICTYVNPSQELTDENVSLTDKVLKRKKKERGLDTVNKALALQMGRADCG